MKKIIKTLGTVVILGTVAMASNMASVTVEDLNTNTMNTMSVDTGYYCDPIERLMGMCRSSQTLLPEN